MLPEEVAYIKRLCFDKGPFPIQDNLCTVIKHPDADKIITTKIITCARYPGKVFCKAAN